MSSEAGRDQAIVLITDGDDQDSMPLDAARDAAARKIRILCIGLGDPTDGGRIPIQDDVGNKTFLKHEGREVWSKVDEQTLREIATITGGLYVPASGKTFDLGQIYVTKLGRMQGSEFQVEHRKRYREQYQIFLAVAVVLLFVYLAVPEYAADNRFSGSS
jgi:Ca-activated chloride channel family protein